MNTRFDLTNQIVLVTGAGSGFGARIAEIASQNGAAVALVGRRRDRLETVRSAIRASADHLYGGGGDAGICVIAADVRVTPVWEVFDQIEDQLGGPVTVLVNNAGVGHADKAVNLADIVWENVIETDLAAPMRYAREMANRLIENAKPRPGSIINIASVFGQRASKGMIAYATAKAGLIHLTSCLAMELAQHGIRVNAIAPGWCLTDMTRAYLTSDRGKTIERDIPIGRFGTVEDLDGLFLLLASDHSRYMTGSCLTVDGGLSCWMRDGRSVDTRRSVA